MGPMWWYWVRASHFAIPRVKIEISLHVDGPAPKFVRRVALAVYRILSYVDLFTPLRLAHFPYRISIVLPMLPWIVPLLNERPRYYIFRAAFAFISIPPLTHRYRLSSSAHERLLVPHQEQTTSLFATLKGICPS
jgi:hypothetical protein